MTHLNLKSEGIMYYKFDNIGYQTAWQLPENFFVSTFADKEF
jgi:hypothetical protein